MSDSISVVIIDSEVESTNRMVKYIKNLGDHVSVEGTASDFDAGFELIHKKRPTVAIIEAGKDVEEAMKRVGTVLGRFPKVSVFVTSDSKSSDSILKLMRAGVTEYFLRPVSETDLASALQKLGRLWVVKPSPEAETGRIYSVFSPKGGVGATTIAINLAAGIYEATKKPTILIDLDLNSGDVSVFLNLKSTYTISDVTSNITRLDRSFLQGVITKHESGIYVMAEPQRVEDGVSISGADLRKVMALLKTMYSYIVVDTESVFDERTMTTVEMSDVVLLACIMSLPGIKNIQRHLNYFNKQGYGRDKVKLIVNRYVKKGNIKLDDAEKVLNYPIFFSIPNDYNSAMTCLNKGEHLGKCAPRSSLNESIKELSKAVVELTTPQEAEV